MARCLSAEGEESCPCEQALKFYFTPGHPQCVYSSHTQTFCKVSRRIILT